MTPFPRRRSRPRPRSGRFRPGGRQRHSKRPLIVLTWQAGQLAAIHSSSPAIQFVKLEVSSAEPAGPEADAFPAPCQATPLSVASLTQLSPELQRAARRAFRRG